MRYVNGIVTAFRQDETGFDRSYYQMIIEPALVRTALQSDSQIFQNQTSERVVRYATTLSPIQLQS